MWPTPLPPSELFLVEFDLWLRLLVVYLDHRAWLLLGCLGAWLGSEWAVVVVFGGPTGRRTGNRAGSQLFMKLFLPPYSARVDYCSITSKARRGEREQRGKKRKHLA